MKNLYKIADFCFFGSFALIFLNCNFTSLIVLGAICGFGSRIFASKILGKKKPAVATPAPELLGLPAPELLGLPAPASATPVLALPAPAWARKGKKFFRKGKPSQKGKASQKGKVYQKGKAAKKPAAAA